MAAVAAIQRGGTSRSSAREGANRAVRCSKRKPGGGTPGVCGTDDRGIGGCPIAVNAAACADASARHPARPIQSTAAVSSGLLALRVTVGAEAEDIGDHIRNLFWRED